MTQQLTTSAQLRTSIVRPYNLMQADLLASPEQLETMISAAESWILSHTPETPPASREMAEDLVRFMFDLHTR